MIKRKHYSVLMVLGMLSVLAFAAGNVSAQTASLTAYATTATITLDGDTAEAAWGDADSFSLTDVDGSGVDVTLKALHDSTHIYMYATWTDATESNTRKGWSYNGTTWTNLGGNEDRMNFAWSIGGADIVCVHNAGNSGGDTTKLFDIWHWKAVRTAPGGWADDKFWDGTGRHSDAKTAGGYSDNSVVAQAADSAAITTALGNNSAVAAFSSDDRPFWDAAGAEITWTAGDNASALTDFISGYKTVSPTGSRGDVQTGSQYDGSSWHVEYKRALDTTNDDDLSFAIGTTYTFYLSLHDNAGDEDHFISGGPSSPQAITLDVSAATGPTTAAPLDTTLLLVVAGGAVAVIVIAVIVLKKR